MTNELRTWIEAQLDAGAGALDLSQAEQDEDDDEDETYTPDDENEATEDDESEGDEEPYSPPTGPALIAAVLGGDLDLGDMSAEEWLAWASGAPPDVWQKAATQAGFPGAEQPRAHMLPDTLRVGLMQQDLDARIAAAREGRR